MKRINSFFVLFLLFVLALPLQAEVFYWTGGSGNWNELSNWKVGEAKKESASRLPGSNDDVEIYSLSNDLTVTINSDVFCRSLIIGQGIGLWLEDFYEVKLEGAGKIHLSEFHGGDKFRDDFTGTWIFENSQKLVFGKTGITKGKIIFDIPQVVVLGNLYVANTVEIRSASFGMSQDFKLIAQDIVVHQGARITTPSQVVNISAPQSPQNHIVTTTVIPNACNGQCNATATANVVGGSGNFSYLWTPGNQTTPTATGLCAGTYLVVVTDLTLGDQVPAFAIVTDPPPLVIFFSNTSPLCNGQCNGSSSATVAGGTPGYTYSWLPGNQTTPVITNQCAGTYTLTITDLNGCQITQQSLITQPAALLPNGSNTDVTCNNSCNGTASVAPTGGTLPYSFLWSPGGQTTSSINGLCPGSYTCTVTDFNNCTSSYVAVITQPSPLQASISSVNASCFGVCDGTATANVSGGTAPFSYVWLPGGQTTQTITNLCAGTYTVNITDANSCTVQQQVTITQPPQLLTAPSVTNVTCFGLCNGIASANASGGSPTYTYNWLPSGGNGATASSLCPGSYTVTVTDQNACSVNAVITITEPQLLVAQATSTNVTCNSLCNGTATAGQTGGTAPYTYVWQPGNITTPTISNLCSGSYTLTVTDVNSCTATTTVTITQPQPITANVTQTNVNCNTACNGTAASSPSGGTGPYTFLWLPGGQTTSSVTGLCAGSYTLTVTDAQGCTRNQTVTITQPNPLTISVNTTQLLCTNNCNATAAVVVSGGTPGYTYLWAPGGQTTPVVNNLCAGSYTVTVTDANGCIANNIVTITQPPPYQVSTSVTNVLCFGQCNGGASVSVSGATAPYSYLWSPGGQTTSSISGLCAGTYSCTVTDANGCDTTLVMTVNQPLPITPNVTSTNASCSGICDGTATSNPGGGTSPYSFLWQPGAQTTSTITGLCSGSYSLTITDANGCTSSSTVTITQPQPLLATITATTASCGLCDGTATVNVSGGTQSYTYSWSPTGGTNPTASGLCRGNYTCTITDANGCVTSVSVAVNQVVNIVVSSVGNTPSCYGVCDGIASANANGGISPYTYVWSPGNIISQNITGLCAGTYTVTATDASGCFNTSTITFTNPPQLQAQASSSDVSCFNACDGSATTVVSGGTGTYTYLWLPGGQTTASVTGLCAGTYSVTISDANSCDTTIIISITQPTQITASPSITPATCTLCDGAIATSASGGTPGYTYLWAPGGQTTSGINGLCPGIYSVTITDASGCSQQVVIPVSNTSGPSVTATPTNASCNGVCNGSATATVTGGAAPFTYDWFPGSPAGDGTPTITGLCAGTYTVQVTDAIGCITFVTVVIIEPQILTAPATITNVTCNGLCNGSITVAASGGTSPYTYNWSTGGTTPTISGLCAGTYTLILTDAAGCSRTLIYSITEPAALNPGTSGTDIVCYGQCNGTASANVTGGVGPYSYLWSNGQIVSSIGNLCPATYTVTITDVNGCTVTGNVLLNEPDSLISVITTTEEVCAGQCNGSASASPTGGVGSYTFLWAPGGQTTSSVSGLCAGAYSLTTSDANGCSVVQSVTVSAPPVLAATTSGSTVPCFGDCSGTVSVVGTGGTPSYSYTWAPGGQTTSNVSGLCAGTYTVTIADINGCQTTASATVAQPALLQANTTFTSPSCNGSCDGTATATPIGGSGGYTYLWAPGGQTTPTISGLCAGTYTVTVRDANGCVDIQTVNVIPVAPITLAVASSPATCGICNGSITVAPSGGSGTYTYSWSGSLPPVASQSNLCAGIYSVTVTDASGCTQSFTLTLNNSNGPTGETVSTSDVSCPGSCDGSATVIPIGGTSPYTYLWNPGGQTVNTLTGMCAGSYFLQVTDANGCIRFSPVTINSPPAIAGNPFVTNTTCTGICDGAISLNTIGGNPAYTYSWAPGGQTTSAISGLCSGGYTVTITDVNGCTQTESVTVSPYNVLVASVAATPSLCNADCNASAAVTVTVGTSPFVYQWTDPLGQSTQTATGLCAGTYSVTVTDDDGCNSVIPVSIVDPQAIQLNPSLVQPSCGFCNGSITSATSGGTAPYTYLWSNGATTPTLSGLCAGVYAVQVTDALGCTEVFTLNMSNSNGPSAANEVITNVTCGNTCDGSIALAPSGGTQPYTYLWLPGSQTTSAVSSLCAGTYTVQITDSVGCVLIDSFSVTAPNAIVLNPIITNTDCGFCNGNINLNASGGNGPLTFLWAPGGQTTPVVNGLCAGLYTVTVTDSIGCTEVRVIPVSNFNAQITITTNSTAISCNGVCDGTASATAAGPNGPFTYLWSNGSTSASLTGLCAGTYLVQVTDATGCVSTAQVIINNVTALTASQPVVSDALCAGVCNGTITAIAFGGTLPYSYNWSNSQTSATASGLCPGVYTVTIRDANGCTISLSDSVAEPTALVSAAPVITDASCNTTADGSADLTFSGGTLPYSYSWIGPGSFTSTIEDLSGVLPGTYFVTVTDANGCTFTDTVVINASIEVIADAGADTSFCYPATVVLSAAASTNATSYSWFELPGMTPVGSDDSLIVNSGPGIHTYLLVAANGICTHTDTVVVNSIAPPLANAGPDISIASGGSAVIGGSPAGPSGATFLWTPSADLTSASVPNPTADPVTSTTYVLLVTDTNGCFASDTMELIVLPAISFPNGFTPNGDGVNDFWQIDNITPFENCEVEVYNRWGELLFRSVGYNTPWDGRYDGQELPVGTYYYVIDLNDPLFPEPYTGPITIMR
ncbi:MAG: gliding motility-associated C-terminal domain-containing protein [Bacteroidota bacterium]